MPVDGRAELELAVKTAEAELAKVARVEELIRDVEKAAERLNKQDVDIDSAGFDKAQKELEETVKAAKKAERALGKLEKEAAGRGKGFAAAFGEMKSAVQGLLAALVVDKLVSFGKELGKIAGEAVQASIDVGRLQNSLEAIEGVDADETLVRISQRAQDLGVDVTELRERTTSFIQSATKLGLTVSESILVIEGLSTAAVGAGKGTGDFSRAIVQLEQALSKGRFEAQDFKTILEVYPGALAALAGALGSTTEETQEWVSKGLLPAKDIAIILAGVLPELFDEQLQKNARDFGSDIQRLKNELTELQEVVGRAIAPELREWLQIFGLIGRQAPDDLGLVGKAIQRLNDNLQGFVQQWVDRWTAAGLAVEGFALDSARRILRLQKVLANLGADLIPGVEESIERSEALLKGWAEAAQGRVAAFAQSLKDRAEVGTKADEEATDRLKTEQEKRLEAALAAAKRALEILRKKLAEEEDTEKESLKRRQDTFLDFLREREDLSGGTEAGVSTPGAGEASSRLGRIADLLEIIKELSPKQLTGITQEELDQLGAAQRELQQLRAASEGLAGSLPAVSAELASVEDFSSRAAEEARRLAAGILAGSDTFEALGDAAQRSVGLAISQLELLAERGGVQAFEIEDVLSSVRAQFQETGESVSQSAEGVFNYIEAQRQAGSATRETGQAAGEAGAAIQRLVADAGNVAFTNLDEEARGAAEGVRVFKGAGEEGRDVIDGFGEGLSKATEEVKRLKGAGEDGRDLFANIEEGEKEATPALKRLTDDGLAPAAEQLTKTGDAAGKLDTSLASIASSADELPGKISAALSAVTENQEGLTQAQAATGSLAESLPAISAALTTAQPAIAEIAKSVPDLLTKINEAKEAGGLEAIRSLVTDVAEKAPEASEGLKVAREALEGLVAAAASGDAEKLKSLVADLASEENLTRLDKLKTAFQEVATQLEAIDKGADGAKDSLEKGKTALEDFLSAVDEKAISTLGDLETALVDIGSALATLEGQFQGWATIAGESIEGVLGQLGKLEKVLDRVGRKLGSLGEQGDEVLGDEAAGGSLGVAPAGAPLAGSRGPVQPGSRAGQPPG